MVREESRVFFHSWRLVLTGRHLYSCVCKVRASCGPFLGSKCFSYLSSFRKQADLNPHWHRRKPSKGFEGAQCVTLKFQAGSCPSLGALTAKWLISMPQSAQGKHHLPCSPGACQSSIGMGSTCSTGVPRALSNALPFSFSWEFWCSARARLKWNFSNSSGMCRASCRGSWDRSSFLSLWC